MSRYISRKYIPFFFILFFFLLTFFSRQPAALEIHMIDVGQGDATLIQTIQGKNLLIDAGHEHNSDELISYLQAQGVQQIDCLIATHPDIDHIGGMIAIMDTFPVKLILHNGHTSSTQFYKKWQTKIDNLSITNQVWSEGTGFSLENNLQFECLSPSTSLISDNQNGYSLVIGITYQLKNKTKRFLLMGDGEFKNETEVLRHSEWTNIELLKIGHHGSQTSTSSAFLLGTKPKAAVISCGYLNDYGHPHPVVLEALEKHHIPIYRTDEQGSIVFSITKDAIHVNHPPASYDSHHSF